MLHATHLRLVILEHARKRARERGVDLAEVVRTVRQLAESDRLGSSDRGIFALRGDDAHGPIAIVKLTAGRVVLKTVLPASARLQPVMPILACGRQPAGPSQPEAQTAVACPDWLQDEAGRGQFVAGYRQALAQLLHRYAHAGNTADAAAETGRA
jgi:hypothetical protein